MMKFSSPVFSEAPLHGLKGPRISFELDGDSQAIPNSRAIAIIKEAFGAGCAEPELDGAPLGIDLLAFNNEHPEKTIVGEVNFGPGLDFGHVRDRFLDVIEL